MLVWGGSKKLVFVWFTIGLKYPRVRFLLSSTESSAHCSSPGYPLGSNVQVSQLSSKSSFYCCPPGVVHTKWRGFSCVVGSPPKLSPILVAPGRSPWDLGVYVCICPASRLSPLVGLKPPTIFCKQAYFDECKVMRVMRVMFKHSNIIWEWMKNNVCPLGGGRQSLNFHVCWFRTKKHDLIWHLYEPTWFSMTREINHPTSCKSSYIMLNLLTHDLTWLYMMLEWLWRCPGGDLCRRPESSRPVMTSRLILPLLNAFALTLSTPDLTWSHLRSCKVSCVRLSMI